MGTELDNRALHLLSGIEVRLARIQVLIKVLVGIPAALVVGVIPGEVSRAFR